MDTTAAKYIGEKSKFGPTFKQLFDVDVDGEDPNVFPNYLCNKHTCLLKRATASLSRGLSYNTDQALFKFTPHNENCSICVINVDALFEVPRIRDFTGTTSELETSTLHPVDPVTEGEPLTHGAK